MSKPYLKSLQAVLRGRVLWALAAWLSGGISSVAAPKDYLVDIWRFDDDLPRDGINSIAQGRDGYLWVSSRFGLARFDGVRFANFSSQVGAQFLGHHYAHLTADQLGAIWIGTPGGGLAQWREGGLRPCLPPGNPVFGPVFGGWTNAQGRELAITPDGRVMGWAKGQAELVADASRWGEVVPASLCQGEAGSLWFVTYQHKLVRVNGTNAQEMVYGSGEERRNWIALQVNATGDLWAGTQRDLGRWRGEQFEPFASPAGSVFPVDDIIAVPSAGGVRGATAAGQSETSRLWVVALGRAWLLEGNRWLTNMDFESSAGLYETSPRMADRAGNLWFTATKGGIVRAGADGSLMQLAGEQGLPPGRIASLFEDREGSIWAGIEHAGLVRLRERYCAPIGTHGGSKAPLVWVIVEDSAGAIWLGTENSGLQRWQEGKLTQFNLGNGGLPGSVYSLCLDRQGTLWAGTGDKGVFRFENGKFAPVWEYPGPGWNKRLYAIYEDDGGRVWFGTGLGLFCWENGTVRLSAGKGFEMGVVRALCKDASGRLWVGMSGGAGPRLACLEDGEWVPRAMPEGLSRQDIFALHADSDGSVWIGTVGGGLWRWRDGGYIRLTTQEGLPDDRIHSISEDREGNLWLGSPAGIIRVSKLSVAAGDAGRTNLLDCLIFDRTDGLPTRECSGGAQPAIFQGRDGRLLFAMTEGAVALWPERIQVNRVPPPVMVEEVRVDGKPRLSDEWPVTGDAASAHASPVTRHSLGPGRHVVEFRYTATSLVTPFKMRFKYRLEGVDVRWREAEKSRAATYALTSPGNYRFHVIACNDDGVWNETGAEVALAVAPYVWQTMAFRVGGSIALLVTVGGSIRFFERRKLQRRLEQLERQQMVEKERARIARDIHDDLGASLTEIGLLSEFAQRDSTPTEQVQADVREIAVKARSSTRALDEIVWAVNPRNDTLEGFVSYACAYAQEQLRWADIQCRLEAATPLPHRPLRADMRHHLFMAFKEALNNVIKHARASQVEIRITAESDHLTVAINDNGSGFARNQKPADGRVGNGLANMRERLESVGGGFECESAPGRGTRITLTMELG